MRQQFGNLFGHGLHAALLLLPTIVLARLSDVSSSIILFATAICIAAACESSFVARYTQSQRDDSPPQPLRDPVAMNLAMLVGVLLLAILWSAQVEHYLGRGVSGFAQIAGLLALFVGTALRCEAIRELGPQFVSDIRVDGRVVTDGVYAWIRHPSEVGLLLFAFGGPLLLGAWVTALLAVAMLLPVSVWRSRRENFALDAVIVVASNCSRSSL